MSAQISTILLASLLAIDVLIGIRGELPQRAHVETLEGTR